MSVKPASSLKSELKSSRQRLAVRAYPGNLAEDIAGRTSRMVWWRRPALALGIIALGTGVLLAVLIPSGQAPTYTSSPPPLTPDVRPDPPTPPASPGSRSRTPGGVAGYPTGLSVVGLPKTSRQSFTAISFTRPDAPPRATQSASTGTTHRDDRSRASLQFVPTPRSIDRMIQRTRTLRNERT